jgi:probable HAF family extracellular repeat protein
MINLNDLFIEEGLLTEDGPYPPFDADLLDGWFVAHAQDINDSGQILVRMTHVADGVGQGQHAFRYTPSHEDSGGTLMPAQLDAIGSPSGGGTFGPNAINNNGEVVGTANANGDDYSAIWTETAGVVVLGQFEGRTTRGLGINDSGQVCGLTNSSYRAWRYTPGVGFENLGVGFNKKHASSRAHAINNSGQVAGASYDGQGKNLAFRFTNGVGLVNLGTLGGNSSSVDSHGTMNEWGDVVGTAQTAEGTSHVFLYTDEFGMADLEAAVVNLPGDLAGGLGNPTYLHVNNQGVVCGRAGDGSGSQPSLLGHTYEAYILEPVP